MKRLCNAAGRVPSIGTVQCTRKAGHKAKKHREMWYGDTPAILNQPRTQYRVVVKWKEEK